MIPDSKIDVTIFKIKLLLVRRGWNHLGSYNCGTRIRSSLLQKKSIAERVKIGTEVKLDNEFSTNPTRYCKNQFPKKALL